jgi:glucose/arabinose dehydrogenase
MKGLRQSFPLAVLVGAWLLPLPAHGELRVEAYVSGLTRPVALIQDPADVHVRYAVEQGGRIRVIRGGLLEPVDFIDLRSAISTGGERGLLGLAFPPDAATSRRLYVSFTNRAGHTVIARFTRSADNPLRADPATRLDLRWRDGRRFIEQPFSNHNGGTLAFGPDGYLYIGLGDGGSSNDPGHRAQRPDTALGKMLRIDVGVPDGHPDGYVVPPDNPFLDSLPVAALPEIWAFGLRNPWKFSFDNPAHGGTGALLIADVGQEGREEVNYEPPGGGGRNYGWRNREGTRAHIASPPPAYTPLTGPIVEYDRTSGRSVAGGFVYRGRLLGAAMRGRYVFGDFVAGRIWSVALTLDQASGDATASDLREHTAELGGAAALGMISGFAEDADGELYVISWDSGRIQRLTSDTPDDSPPATAPPVAAPTPERQRHPDVPYGRFPGQRRE